MSRLVMFSALMAVSGVAAAGSGAPVEFSTTPVKAGDVRMTYTVKVKADHVTQVDFHVKYLDGAGKVLRETDVVWQNIVSGEQKPIKKGETYTDKHRMPEGTAKAEAQLLRVFFKDGKTWSAGK